MNKVKWWSKKSKRISILISIIFLLIFVILLVFSIIFTKLAYPNIEPIEDAKVVDWFSTQVSNSFGMNIPFSIFIQLITSIGGVFLGIRIGQWIDEKEEAEKLLELWNKTNIFLIKLNSGIYVNKNMYELYEYRIYWESIQKADTIATRLLQEDEKYTDITFAFSFLYYYKDKWEKFENTHQWELNASISEKERINEWKNKINELIEYTTLKSQKSKI